MIKRVIFDIDNTLIPWKKEYNIEINHSLEKLNIEYVDEDVKNISKAFDEYENEYYIFDKELMADFINKYTSKNYPKELIYTIIEKWENSVPDKIDKSIIELLEYLKSKYELVILTDWFKKEQSKRLEKTNILKYFSNVYCAEKTKRKPFKEAFMQAIGNYKPEECIMIGDDIERDIKGALNAGINAIWYNSNNEIKDIECKKNKKYKMITKLEQLRDIL